MLNILSLNTAMDALIPITRFNKGEASKIFDEVKEAGCKVVVKNNTPTCILLTPEKYREMTKIIEDQYLLALAEENSRKDKGQVSFEELLAQGGLTLADIDTMEIDSTEPPVTEVPIEEDEITL